MTLQRDSIETQNRKLRKINQALMARVERATDISGSGFALFQTAIALEGEVRARTNDLQGALHDLSLSNSRLKQAHGDAVQARTYLADALEAVQEGFAFFDPDDRLVICNTRFRSLFSDVSRSVGPGLDFAEYARRLSVSRDLVLPEGQTPRDWAAFRENMHRKPHATFTVELSEDRWIQVSERRTATGATAVLQTDITAMIRQQRRERDKIIDEHDRIARATMDHLSQGVCTFDADQRLAACNSRFRDLLSLPYDLTKTGADLAQMVDYVFRNGIVRGVQSPLDLRDWLARPGSRAPVSAEFHRGDGAVMDVSLRHMPGGGFVASFTDVTAKRMATRALRRANETLEQRVAERTAELTAANEALTRENAQRELTEQALREAKEAAEAAKRSNTRFLAAASHDLLQPLNAAKLFISTLGEMPMGRAQAEVTSRIAGAFDSVETLLQALLEISLLDAGGAEFTLSDFPLSDILDPLDQEFKPLAAARGLRLRIRPSGLWIRSDPRYFRRIAQNLVANAVKYTSHGAVLVGCRRRGDALRFEVWDTGPGMKPEDQQRVFEEFQRLDQDNEIRGMGLGLSIVKHACKLLDHPLSLRSVPGSGSVFAVEAPITRRAPGPAPDAAPEDESAQSAVIPNLIAVVIENEPEVLFAMTKTLERWGASVVPAAATDEAAAALNDLGLPPDIIIADYHLDGDDTGLRSIAALRAAWGAKLPAIVVTADRSESLAGQARAMGVDLLAKPVEARELRSLITWRCLAAL